MPFTTDICNGILKYYFGRGVIHKNYDNLYVALFKNDPETDPKGTYDELSGNGYERVHILNKDNKQYPDYLTDPDARTVYNKNEIHFKKATDVWEEAKGFGIFGVDVDEEGNLTEDPQETANLIYYAKLDNPVNVPKDGVALFDPETLKISFAEEDVAIPEE